MSGITKAVGKLVNSLFGGEDPGAQADAIRESAQRQAEATLAASRQGAEATRKAAEQQAQQAAAAAAAAAQTQAQARADAINQAAVARQQQSEIEDRVQEPTAPEVVVEKAESEADLKRRRSFNRASESPMGGTSSGVGLKL